MAGRRRDWVELAAPLSDLDRALLRLLRDDGRRPVEQLAAELGAAKRTLRRRMHELEQRGALRIVAAGHPQTAGRPLVVIAGVRLDGAQPAAEAARRLAEATGAVHAAVVSGRYHVLLELWSAGPDQLLDVVDRRLAGAPGIAASELHPRLRLAYQTPAFALARAAAPPPAAAGIELDDLDRAVVSHLQADGRATYQAVAAKLGVTDNQVRGRVRRLTAAGAIHITSLADPDAVGLSARASIAVRTLSGASAAEVADRLAELPAVTHVAVVAGRFQLLA